MRLLQASMVLAMVGCAESSLLDEDHGADINDGLRDDDKADGATGIEVLGRLRPGAAGKLDLKLTAASPRQGFIFFASEGAKVSIENTSSAESRIRDVDVASETAILTRNQVLQQAGIAVLAQANISTQSALSLLRG